MTIRIISVGKKHDSFIQSIIEEYEKRLRKFSKVEWIIVPPSHSADKDQQITEESQAITKHLKVKDVGMLLDERGKQYTNEQFAVLVNTNMNQGASLLCFIIGGAYGVDDALRQRSDFIWSLSPLVFPHQLVRVMLVEQLYRTFMLLKNHPYHHQ